MYDIYIYVMYMYDDRLFCRSIDLNQMAMNMFKHRFTLRPHRVSTSHINWLINRRLKCRYFIHTHIFTHIHPIHLVRFPTHYHNAKDMNDSLFAIRIPIEDHQPTSLHLQIHHFCHMFLKGRPT